MAVSETWEGNAKEIHYSRDECFTHGTVHQVIGRVKLSTVASPSVV
jgi:hypothetical protein